MNLMYVLLDLLGGNFTSSNKSEDDDKFVKMIQKFISVHINDRQDNFLDVRLQFVHIHF